MSTPYEHINEFCNGKSGATDQHKAMMLYRFYNDYNQAVADYKAKNGQEPSEAQRAGYESILLQTTTLESSFLIVSGRIKDEVQSEIDRHVSKTKVRDFGLSVLASIVASFLYTVLLIIVIRVAQNQVKSLLYDLYSSDQQITTAVEQNSSKDSTNQ